ncbi:MAG: glycosyltransferase [Candidatus Omnitrophica bacterium]|nr:glycosyltransferase [Candidatus Omnitrophota bacterium]
MKNIIIFYISEFGGHNKAANNIKEALLYKNPALSVQNINGFGYFYPRTERFADSLYTTTVRHFPAIWGRIYDRKKVIKNLSPLRRWVSAHTFKKLSGFIKKSSPDCFVATQAFPCGLLADFKESFNCKIPLIAVVTDYHPHGFWIHKAVDKYIVASCEAKEVLINNGVDKEKIEILGIPISFKFLNRHLKENVAKELGFIKESKSILIMGGGLGIGPIEKIAKELDKSAASFQIITICGKNKKLYKWFEKNKQCFKKPLFYFGYVDFINKIMDFADIIITKSGGITISEALAKGLAIIVSNPIPGQEEHNVNYLLKNEAVIRADEPQEIGRLARELLENSEKMNLFKENAKRISLPDSSLRIAELILSKIS